MQNTDVAAFGPAYVQKYSAVEMDPEENAEEKEMDVEERKSADSSDAGARLVLAAGSSALCMQRALDNASSAAVDSDVRMEKE